MKSIYILLLCSITLFLCGCPQSGDNSPPDTAPSAPVSETNTSGETEDGQLRITDETPLPPSVLGTMPSVQEALDKMIKAYKTVDYYIDSAVVITEINYSGKETRQTAPYSVCFEKPNKFRFQSRSCEICADGERLSVNIPSIPGVILQAPCPNKITLESLLFDPAIIQALSINQAGTFSFLPLQWVLLLAEDPLKTITFSQTEIRMLSPADLMGNKCYRLRIDRQDGTAILWIDQNTGLLLRAQLPPQQLLQNLEGEKPTERSLTIDFRQAETNIKIPPASFRMNLPPNIRMIDKYDSPQSLLLGKPLKPIRVASLDSKSVVTNEKYQGKVLVLNYWASWNRSSEMTIKALSNVQKHFQSNPNVQFLAVSADDATVSDQAVRDVLNQWGSSLPSVRDSAENLTKTLGFNSIPATLVIGPTGTIENIQIGFQAMLEKNLIEWVNQLLVGESIYSKALVAMEQDELHFQGQIHDWIEQGIFVDQDVIFQAKIPQTDVAPVSNTTTFSLTPLWAVDSLQNPGGMLTDPNGKVWVLENGRKVAGITSEGTIAARYDLSLDSKEVCSFIRAFKDGKGQIYYLAFAPGQQRIHVYNDQWRLRFHYPPDALQRPHEGIYDARFGDLTGDKVPEVYLGCLGTQGVQSLDIDGKLRWSNRSVGTVFMVAPYHNKTENQLLCVGTSGAIAVLSKEGKNLAQFALPDQALAAIYAADLDNSGTDRLCGLSVFNFSVQRLFGFNNRGALLWSYDLPQGMQKRPVDYILTGKIQKEEPQFWIVLGPDGSVHFINSEGLLMDRFNRGSFIYGLTIADWSGVPVLLLSDERGVSAFRISE